jgi:hypothetical protein
LNASRPSVRKPTPAHGDDDDAVVQPQPVLFLGSPLLVTIGGSAKQKPPVHS